MNQSLASLVPIIAGIAVVVLLGALSSKLFDKTSLVRRVWTRRILALAAIVVPHVVVYIVANTSTLLIPESGWFWVWVGQGGYALWLVYQRPDSRVRVPRQTTP